MKNKKVAMLLSGGVDSSVAMYRLIEDGYEIEAFYLKIWLEDELSYLNSCPYEEDLKYAESVCDKLNIKLHILNFQKDYFDKVVKYTISEIEQGRTPNPDVMCNNSVKFGAFFDKINKDYNFDFIASGHYANKGEYNGKTVLKKAEDSFKDQCYFLANLKDEQLEKIIFPLGHLKKSEVREIAKDLDLLNADRKDSQGICFLGKFKFNDFIKHYLGVKKGDIVDFDTQEKLGEHEGFYFHTIGQRKGLGLSGGPYYVVSKDTTKNVVYVSKNYFKEKPRNELYANNLNIFGKIELPEKLEVKLRHGEQLYDAIVTQKENNLLHIQLNENDQGIAPGQFVVFFKDEFCLGSGVIVNPVVRV